MTDREQKKRANFARLFPARVEKNREQLRVIGNCSNKTNYEWNENQVRLAFGLLIREYISTARLFGIEIEAQVNGIDVRTLD